MTTGKDIAVSEVTPIGSIEFGAPILELPELTAAPLTYPVGASLDAIDFVSGLDATSVGPDAAETFKRMLKDLEFSAVGELGRADRPLKLYSAPSDVWRLPDTQKMLRRFLQVAGAENDAQCLRNDSKPSLSKDNVEPANAVSQKDDTGTIVYLGAFGKSHYLIVEQEQSTKPVRAGENTETERFWELVPLPDVPDQPNGDLAKRTQVVLSAINALSFAEMEMAIFTLTACNATADEITQVLQRIDRRTVRNTVDVEQALEKLRAPQPTSVLRRAAEAIGSLVRPRTGGEAVVPETPDELEAQE